MSAVKSQQALIELQYIDSLFYESSGTEVIESTLETSENINDETNICKDNENIYQFISISQYKFTIKQYEILNIINYIDVTLNNGIFEYGKNTYYELDISILFMPNQLSPEKNYLLLLKDKNIALSCKILMDLKEIDNETVCWKVENSNRQWLSGIIKSEQVAILDLSILQQMHFDDQR
ncbi:MAG: hypothetical protein COB77_03255 [Gammaproteobacteria bacterium]|nr:MAG: hypothetical protein COB77_03255 [Gammaproteobacteria bacterium]